MTRDADPARLLRSETHAGHLLRGYARRTTPGTTPRQRDDAAAWHRLRVDLEGETDSARATFLRTLRRAFSPSRVVTLALGLFLLVKLAPLLPRLDAARANAAEANALGGSGGGVASAAGIEGAGGMEGSGG